MAINIGDIDEEEWAIGTRDDGAVLTFHQPCEVYFHWEFGPEGDGNVPLKYILDEMAKHEAECD